MIQFRAKIESWVKTLSSFLKISCAKSTNKRPKKLHKIAAQLSLSLCQFSYLVLLVPENAQFSSANLLKLKGPRIAELFLCSSLLVSEINDLTSDFAFPSLSGTHPTSPSRCLSESDPSKSRSPKACKS